ncbi:MAG: hypothetical protein KGJ13_02945 [Patescibacteria group bacterium]|nr:hypothetical protein [Patescibacteria group bacterium]
MRIPRIFAVFLLAGLFIGVSASFVPLSRAHAVGTSLYLGPATGTFTVGSTFTVSLYVNTGGQSVNAIQANLAFPPDKLQVVSPSSGQSVIQIWMNQPTYSNLNGTLSFQGAVPNPGINTDAGLLSTVTFRVIATGVAAVSIVNSNVYLNNGEGTNVLGAVTNGIYHLTLPPPEGPIVSSPTNPDQNKWYRTETVALAWAPEPGVAGYSYMMSDNPTDEPDDISLGMQTQVSYSHLSDGVHYFHIKAFRNGVWGGVTSFAVNVDNAPPAAFGINILPGRITDNKTPTIEFGTTDAASGLDHYEVEVVPLDQPAANASNPMFIEADSPYSQPLNFGNYDVIVRAYDIAGNYRQETVRLVIAPPLFQIISNTGLRIGDRYTIGWPFLGIGALLVIAILILLLRRLWRLHEEMNERLIQGAAQHPEVLAKLEELKQKQREFENMVKRLTVVVLAVGCSWALAVGHWPLAHAATGNNAQVQNPAAQLAVNAPIINLAPSSISNKEVLYLGGWANVPNADVVITIEHTETGETFNGAAVTGPDGNWFYSFPQLLDPGHYVAWAQLKFAGQSSAPSARVDVSVQPTAFQVGGWRLDYQSLYLLLAILFFAVVVVLLAAIIHHTRQFRLKKARFSALIREAEESVRRGFSVLRRDLELELSTVQKAKLEGELSMEEKIREARLVKDLDYVDRYIGKEIWKIEEEEKEL